MQVKALPARCGSDVRRPGMSHGQRVTLVATDSSLIRSSHESRTGQSLIGRHGRTLSSSHPSESGPSGKIVDSDEVRDRCRSLGDKVALVNHGRNPKLDFTLSRVRRRLSREVLPGTTSVGEIRIGSGPHCAEAPSSR